MTVHDSIFRVAVSEARLGEPRRNQWPSSLVNHPLIFLTRMMVSTSREIRSYAFGASRPCGFGMRRHGEASQSDLKAVLHKVRKSVSDRDCFHVGDNTIDTSTLI